MDLLLGRKLRSESQARTQRARNRARADATPMMPSLIQRRLQCYLALMISDVLAILGSFALSGFLYLDSPEMIRSLKLAHLLLPVFLTVGLYNGAYTIASLKRTSHSILRAAQALVLSSTGVVFIAFYTKSSQDFSRISFTAGVGLSFLAMSWSRANLRGFVRWRCGSAVLNELVIDDGGPPVALKSGFHVSAKAFGLEPGLNDPHALDRIGLVMRNADRVIVSTPLERRAAWSVILKGANVDGEVIDETVAQLSATGARLAGGQGLLQVSVGPLSVRDQLTKRAFDVAMAAATLLVLAPLLLVVALAIKLEDGGPIFFAQRRVGRGNRFFTILKFRSMSENRVGREGDVSTARGDQRVTRIGKFIRRTSIDELPQLFNVLRGDMSVVGPRPHAIGSQAGDKLFWEVSPRYWERHALCPGLTGLAQIRGLRGATESESDLTGRLNADLEYLDGWTLSRDLWIIFATLGVLVHDRAF